MQALSLEVAEKHFMAILTHDIIHERVDLYKKHGWPLDFYPLTETQ